MNQQNERAVELQASPRPCDKCHHFHTPGEQCSYCADPNNRWSGNQGCEGAASLPLTAEQFYCQKLPKDGPINQFMSYEIDSDEVREKIFEFAEAYRASQTRAVRDAPDEDVKEVEIQARAAVANGDVSEEYVQLRVDLTELRKERDALKDETKHLRVVVDACRSDASRSGKRVQALEAQNRWIPVEEKLPPTGERVLIGVHGIGQGLGHRTRTTGLWNGKEWSRGSLEKPIGHKFMYPIEGTVTHWRKIPPPPLAEASRLLGEEKEQ